MVLLLIIYTALAWGLCWLAIGIADHRHHRALPPVDQPVRAAAPPLPSRIHGDLSRARTARASHARHRRAAQTT